MDLTPELLAQLLDTFEDELGEQLQTITDGLIRLEQDGRGDERTELLQSMFRSAHNIKGAARIIEIDAVADLAHQLESVFTVLKESAAEIGADTIDVSLQALDVMRTSMSAHRTGTPVGPELASSLESLAACERRLLDVPDTDVQSAPKANPPGPTRSAPAAHEVADVGQPAIRAQTEAPRPPSHPDTPAAPTTEAIRIRLDKLTRISVLAEDLVVTQVGLREHYKEMLRLVEGLRTMRSYLKGPGRERQAFTATPDRTRDSDRSLTQADQLLRAATALSDEMNQTLRRIHFMSNALQDDARMLRLVPATSVLQPMVRAGRDIGRQLGKPVEVEISGGDIEVDKAVIDRIRDPLTHLVRNAIDHGIESAEQRQARHKPTQGRVGLSVRRIDGLIEIRVEDDGQGIDTERLKEAAVERGDLRPEELAGLSEAAARELMFRPGLTVKRTVSDISGRGVGLDVVRSNIEELNGDVKVESKPGAGTTFIITLPLTLSTERGLQVETHGTSLVIPSTSVRRIIQIEPADILQVEGDHAVLVDGTPVPVRDLGGMLGLTWSNGDAPASHATVVIQRGTRSMALIVDQIEGEREIVIKPLQYPLVSVKNVSGATLTRQGKVVMVLSVPDLLEQIGAFTHRTAPNPVNPAEEVRQHVLVVDDSVTTRNLERNILEIHGYEVTSAINGLEAWNLLQQQSFDMVVTDVEMPEMDGFTLTENIRNDASISDTPVVIVSSLAREEERRRGMEAGASAYIVKGTFETQVLLDAVRQII